MKCKSEKVVKILFMFALAVVFCNFRNVEASRSADYNNKCEYSYPFKETTGYFNVYSKKDKSEISSTDDLKIERNGKGYYFGSGEEINSFSTGLFVVYNNQLYCPDYIYLCSNRQAVKTIDGCPELNVVEASLTSSSGIAHRYVSKKNKTDTTVTTCITGDSDKELKQIYNRAEALNKATVSDSTSDSSSQIITKYVENKSNNPVPSICNSAEALNYFNVAVTNYAKVVENDPTANSDQKEKAKANADSVKENVSAIMNNNANFDLPGEVTETTCEGLIDADLMTIINLVLNIVRIGTPILLLVLITVDFAQVVISNDTEAMPKAISRSVKRAIAAVVIFFIPYIVSLIISWLNDAGLDASNCIK